MADTPFFVLANRLSFVVPGPPVPKARPRLGPGGVVYTPRATAAYENKVALCAQIAVQQWEAIAKRKWPSDAKRYAVTMQVNREYENKGGDWDNYAKAICDGMNRIVYADDRYVRRATCEVLKAQDGERVNVLVEVML